MLNHQTGFYLFNSTGSCESSQEEKFPEASLLMFVFSVKYERIKFLVLALKNSVEVYAWAPKPYHKFMAFKVSRSSFASTNHNRVD